MGYRIPNTHRCTEDCIRYICVFVTFTKNYIQIYLCLFRWDYFNKQIIFMYVLLWAQHVWRNFWRHCTKGHSLSLFTEVLNFHANRKFWFLKFDSYIVTFYMFFVQMINIFSFKRSEFFKYEFVKRNMDGKGREKKDFYSGLLCLFSCKHMSK